MELDLAGFRYLGKGPEASGVNNGWNRSSKIYYRCGQCGDMVKSNHQKNYSCKCKSMFIDSDACRLGSSNGDNDIGVYEKAEL